MTFRYLGILSDGEVSRYRLPDLDWLAHRSSRRDEHDAQMGDMHLLFQVLSDLRGLPDDVAVRGYVWLIDGDGEPVDAHLETAYGQDHRLVAVRFVHDKTPSQVEVLAEFDLTKAQVYFGTGRRWS